MGRIWYSRTTSTFPLFLTMNGASAPNGTAFANGGGTGFLSFNSHPPRVYVTAEDNEFDETAFQNWRDEGGSYRLSSLFD
jgi:hypothetical protein